LAESTSAKTVFDEVLATAGKDIVTKDISRLRGGWPMQDAFYVSLSFFSNKHISPLLNFNYNLFSHNNDYNGCMKVFARNWHCL